MGILQESLLILAQARSAAPDAFDVRLIDEGNAWWADFAIPGATLVAALVGGIGGVLVGGRMNRNTMHRLEADRAKREAGLEADRAKRQAGLEAERAEREARLEADRAEREARLDAAKAARDDKAKRRLALGSLRLLTDELMRARSDVKLERDSPGDDPLLSDQIDTQVHVRSEDKHAIAMWVSGTTWELISLTLEQIELVDIHRRQYRTILNNQGDVDPDWYRSIAATAVERIDSTLEVIEVEIGHLETP